MSQDFPNATTEQVTLTEDEKADLFAHLSPPWDGYYDGLINAVETLVANRIRRVDDERDAAHLVSLMQRRDADVLAGRDHAAELKTRLIGYIEQRRSRTDGGS